MEVDGNFNYQQKTVSSTGNEMLVEFVTDQELTNQGFHAKFHYVQINPDCNSWLGSQYLISPDYPIIDCNWVISAPMGSTITIEFSSIEVYFQMSF